MEVEMKNTEGNKAEILGDMAVRLGHFPPGKSQKGCNRRGWRRGSGRQFVPQKKKQSTPVFCNVYTGVQVINSLIIAVKKNTFLKKNKCKNNINLKKHMFNLNKLLMIRVKWSNGVTGSGPLSPAYTDCPESPAVGAAYTLAMATSNLGRTRGEAGKESLESIAFQYVSRLSQMLRRLLPGSDKGAKTWYLGYFHTMYLGIRSRQSGENDRWRFYWKMVYEYADVSMLHLLATFLESAPQLVLQLCIVVQTRTLQALQGLTAAASLVSLAWALASYQKALRDSRDDKKPISYMAVIIQFCWHFFTIAARVITFALFASVFQLYFGIFIVLHWCIMTFWIVHCETEFCITKWEEIVFDMVVGIIYIFSWFNVKEGRTRCRLFIYYFVILLENTALSVLWYLYKAPPISDAFAIPALCVVFSSFLTGIVFMLMYYAFFHPNGPRFGQSPSCACEDPATAFTLPPEVATSTLRSISNNRSVTSERDQKFGERDGCVPVFQVRPTAPSTPSSRPPRIEESVIKIDLFRNRYPAWERHVLDRSLRKAILAFECSPAPPRLQYKDDALIQERLEYETTL
ncbi:hypothetical protein HGM15179_015669 [Zosterops borbonicus]|uniref:XK-related protein n=1 Tax=Zosterops borbonicus TaxID=364589 RepID=A0A8K1G4E0_9PASS|nr:hypothetical protein HGM15179_015669 [Zosterops borbonicus]